MVDQQIDAFSERNKNNHINAQQGLRAAVEWLQLAPSSRGTYKLLNGLGSSTTRCDRESSATDRSHPVCVQDIQSRLRTNYYSKEVICSRWKIWTN